MMLLLAIPTICALNLDAAVTRRAAVVAAAAGAFAPWAAHAVDKEELKGVVGRAQSGKLTTEGVIGRALLNDMVRLPASIACCVPAHAPLALSSLPGTRHASPL